MGLGGKAAIAGNNRPKHKHMLIGEFKHTLDDKKRISLPIKFRKEIGKKIIITRGLDNCLFMYQLKEWNTIASKLGGLGMGQAGTRGFNRFMLAGASEVAVDSVGRILIPDHLREFAGVKQQVVFAGVHNRVEIWDNDRWEDYKKNVLKDADQMAQKLGEIGAI